MKVRDIILWTLFGGIAGLLFGSLLGGRMWWGIVIGLVLGFGVSMLTWYRRKKEEERYQSLIRRPSRAAFTFTENKRTDRK